MKGVNISNKIFLKGIINTKGTYFMPPQGVKTIIELTPDQSFEVRSKDGHIIQRLVVFSFLNLI